MCIRKTALSCAKDFVWSPVLLALAAIIATFSFTFSNLQKNSKNMEIDDVETKTEVIEVTEDDVKNVKSILRKDLGTCQMCNFQAAKYSCPGCEVLSE
jgi:hypothetical protein